MAGFLSNSTDRQVAAIISGRYSHPVGDRQELYSGEVQVMEHYTYHLLNESADAPGRRQVLKAAKY
jgi:hypothetical protein